MAVTATPIFTQTPKSSFAFITGVDGSALGTDADVQLLYTAGADGAYINKIVMVPISTSGSTTTSACALRIYINNGSAVGTAANNVLFREVSFGAIAVNVAATVAATDYQVPLGMQLQAGYRIYVGVTALAANTQWNATIVAADY